MPHTHPGSTRSAQFLSSLALCKLWPQPTAALGPSWLETAERQHPDEPGEAPGCQAPWVGHGSGAWQESFPRRNSTKAGSQPLCQPMDKAAGSPGAPFLLLLPLLRRAQPASCRVHAAVIPGLCGPSSPQCPARLDPGDELSMSQPPQVVFSLSTLESGSLALE